VYLKWHKPLRSSWEAEECKPLPQGSCYKLRVRRLARSTGNGAPNTRGVHSSNFRLNVSALSGVGGALKGCAGGI